MKKTPTQLAAACALLQFLASAELSLFAQAANFSTNTVTLPRLQTLPALPASGRNASFVGEVVANVGDVNADGYDDWALGLKDAALYPSGKKVGKVHIYFGGNALANEKAPDVILTGEADADRFGNSVAAAGDVNHDGFADVIVGASWNNAGGLTAGRAYLYFGGARMDNIADVVFTGEYHIDRFGNSVSSAGDVNHDGFSDVIVGAYLNDAAGRDAGRAYLYLGGTNMDNVADVIFSGEAGVDHFGNCVASAGDVNRDGFADVLIGAYENNAGGFDAGRAYIYLGGTNMDNLADVILTGEADFDNFGISLAAAGDVNHDGFSDVIVGAHLNDAGGNEAGRAYIYFGGPNMNNLADVVLTGEASLFNFGNSVASAGDVNRDGFADVIVGSSAAERAYLYFGGPSMDNLADVVFSGENSFDLFGFSVSSAGDVNRDGFADVIVGAHWNHAGGTLAGRAYLYFGSASMDNTSDVIFTGEASGDACGVSVASAGDVNADGFADVIIGAYLNDAAGEDAGCAYIYFGGAGANNIPDVILTGEAAHDHFGVRVASAGDVNHDGFADVIVGASMNSANGILSGRAYLYFGGPSMDNLADVIFTGETSYDYFGASLAAAGDVNRDGFADVIIGAEGNDAGGFDAGRAYIYFGGANMDNLADVTLTGAAGFDNFGHSVATAGDVNHDGFSEVIVGAYLNDAGGTDAGSAYLYFGGPNMDNTADVIFTGAASLGQFGNSVSAAGDVNHDGFADVIIGANVANRAYLYLGGANMNNAADAVFSGATSNEAFGISVSSAGDVNADGFADVLVGAFWNSAGGYSAGRAYLYLGGANTNTVADAIFNGEANDDLFGMCVAAAGDVNRDGFADLIIGAPKSSAVGYEMGRAYVYAGSTTVSVEEQTHERTGRFQLYQNYPNPFNPTTTIRFSLSQRQRVVLKIFDLLGKEIATLVAGDFDQGEHAVNFNGSGLASGVYLYRLQTGSFVEQKKLVLMR